MIKEAVILIGLPCTGKSTYIKQAKEALEAAGIEVAVISSDDHVDRLAAERGQTYSEAFKDVADAAMKAMEEDVKDAIAAGKFILWDQTNLNVKARKAKIKRLTDAGYTVHARVFELPEDFRKGLQAKRAKETGKDIPAFVIANMRKSYEAPTHEEGFENIIHNIFDHDD